jgi:hypothetical protein
VLTRPSEDRSQPSKICYRKLSTRPRHHAQREGAIEILKSFPSRLQEIAREKGVAARDLEIWFGNEV